MRGLPNISFAIASLCSRTRNVAGASVVPNAMYAPCRMKQTPLAMVVPPVVQNLFRGSVLKCLADVTGGLVSANDKLDVLLQMMTPAQPRGSTPRQRPTPSAARSVEISESRR